MIPIEKDVSVSYKEVLNLISSNQKNNLVFCEKLSKTTQAVDFCKYIRSEDDLTGLVTQADNPKIYDFLRMFLLQQSRPEGFWLAATSSEGSPGYLITGNLDNWNTFISKFNDTTHPEIRTSVCFKISYGSVPTVINYEIAGDDLLDMTSYVDLINALPKENVNILLDTDSNTITFATKVIGPTEGVLTYLENANAGINEGGKLLSGAQPDWGTFKDGLGNATTFSFKINKADNNQIFEYSNVNVSAMGSWDEFVIALNALSTGTVKVYFINGKLLFVTTARGDAASMGNATSDSTTQAGTNIAEYMKIKDTNEAVLIQGSAVISTVDAAEALKGKEDSVGAKNIPGAGDIHSDPILMKKFADIIFQNKVLPIAVCLSRYLTLDDDSNTDVDVTKNLINGFNQYFGYNQQPTTCILCIASNIYQVEDGGLKKNAYEDVIGTPNSRNIILHYPKTLDEYIEGAIATYAAGIPWEDANTARNFKGLDFSGVTPDEKIDTTLADQLTGYHFNYYGVMSNGMNMFRDGITCSSGDTAYIDTAVGINALIIDLKDKLIRILKEGRIRFNAEGISKIYATLQNVCAKYERNGFLSSLSYTQIVEGEEKTTVLQPYTINISRNYTSADITSRSFPATEVLICSSRFANSFTINLADAFMAAG
jgi:hypothetical protein